jgi:hypothetical protein
MKLKNVKNLGRFEHTQTMQAVNLKQGKDTQTGIDRLFYLIRGKRQFLSDAEFYGGKWVKID